VCLGDALDDCQAEADEETFIVEDGDIVVPAGAPHKFVSRARPIAR
jgi:mannose-6-phosphate isomerase-like protein (cupin superfamily)